MARFRALAAHAAAVALLAVALLGGSILVAAGVNAAAGPPGPAAAAAPAVAPVVAESASGLLHTILAAAVGAVGFYLANRSKVKAIVASLLELRADLDRRLELAGDLKRLVDDVDRLKAAPPPRANPFLTGSSPACCATRLEAIYGPGNAGVDPARDHPGAPSRPARGSESFERHLGDAEAAGPIGLMGSAKLTQEQFIRGYRLPFEPEPEGE